MGSYMEIFEARVLGENLSFWLKNHKFWELCLVYATTSVDMDRFELFLHVACNYLSWMGFYMEIFEARVLGENLYLHQRFTQCSKWSTFCILFRSCCNILHPSIKYVIH